MKYISIDIETTGIDFKKDQILSVGAVIESTDKLIPLTELPYFHALISHKRYTGDAFALQMNHKILAELATANNPCKGCECICEGINNKTIVVTKNTLAFHFEEWLKQNKIQGKFNIAGKNVEAFDKKFLNKLPYWKSNIHHRIPKRALDPAILCVDWKQDKVLPDLKTCLSRIDVRKEVSHTAVEDALDVIAIIRKKTNDYQG